MFPFKYLGITPLQRLFPASSDFVDTDSSNVATDLPDNACGAPSDSSADLDTIDTTNSSDNSSLNDISTRP